MMCCVLTSVPEATPGTLTLRNAMDAQISGRRKQIMCVKIDAPNKMEAPLIDITLLIRNASHTTKS